MSRAIENALSRLSASEAARCRLLSSPGEPLFIADWDRALMIHYEVDGVALQRKVPFELDLWNGRAFVSLVAFTLRGMRPRLGGRVTALLLKPIATHEFLNVRTYVRQGREVGIYFLREWLSNRLSVILGPRFFGLPYKFGKLEYKHSWESGTLAGRVVDADGGGLTYHGDFDPGDSYECEPGTLHEWLMERYTAFTNVRGRPGFFRVWHPPWLQWPVEVVVTHKTLLDWNWPFFKTAVRAGANFSRGLRNVWMGRLHNCR